MSWAGIHVIGQERKLLLVGITQGCLGCCWSEVQRGWAVGQGLWSSSFGDLTYMQTRHFLPG